MSVASAVLFLAAVIAAGWAGLNSAQGLQLVVLLLGLAAIAALGLFAFGSADPARDAPAESDVLEGLGEAAALAASDGRVLATNAAWRGLTAARRLPRGAAAPQLFEAMAAARAGRPGRAELSLGGETVALTCTAAGEDRFLFRRETRAAESAATAVVAPVAIEASAPAAIDAFAGQAPFGAAIVDGEDLFTGTVVEANPAFSRLSDGAVGAGVSLGQLFEASSLDEARAALGRHPNGPIEVKLTGDRPAQLYVSGSGDRRLVYLMDVAEQKRLELQLAQAQKMQAIGQLAGGVAHDFNNLLTAIQLRLDELLLRHPVGDPSYEGLNEIRQTGVRAADLVRKLLAFSRKQTVKRETLDVGELISEFEVLLRRLLREDVKLVTEYGRDLPKVHADKSQLETAVMNLAVNARDAMKAHGGGTVRIRTARLTQAEARDLGWAEAPGEGCALIEVGDDGPGIPPDLQAKIFEPFFTTKPVGEGTGMGLATVYGIVEQADGHIHLHSKPGEGAHFRIFLPTYTPPAGAVVVETKVEEKKPRDLSGAGKILFVEDEDAVRGVAARLLRARGYEVIEAGDGEEALLLAEEHAGQIDMLISDVIMPGLDGPSLLKKARPYLGDAAVMFISGYAEAEFSDLLEGEQGVSFLPKPLDIKTLAERVKQELRRAA